MPTAKINGTDIYYEIHGEGVPLLLIAGLASDSRSWGDVTGRLSKDFMVISPDNRGAGRSPLMTGELSISQMADDCVALLDSLEIPSSHIAGHSMGGFIAQEIAITHPERADSLILEATASSCRKEMAETFLEIASRLEKSSDKAQFFMEIFSLIFSSRVLSNTALVEEMVRFAIEDPWPQSLENFKAQVNALKGFDRSADVKNIRTRTLVVAGEEDRVVTLDESLNLSKSIPCARLEVIKEAAHAMHVEKVDLFCGIVGSFIRAI